MRIRTPAHVVQVAIVLLGAIACVILGRTSHSAAAPVTPTSIAQIPLTLAIPAHPQIVIALGNSASMDGNLSAFPLPELDVTGDGKLDLSDVVLDRGRAKQRISWWEVRQ